MIKYPRRNSLTTVFSPAQHFPLEITPREDEGRIAALVSMGTTPICPSYPKPAYRAIRRLPCTAASSSTVLGFAEAFNAVHSHPNGQELDQNRTLGQHHGIGSFLHPLFSDSFQTRRLFSETVLPLGDLSLCRVQIRLQLRLRSRGAATDSTASSFSRFGAAPFSSDSKDVGKFSKSSFNSLYQARAQTTLPHNPQEKWPVHTPFA